MVRQRVIESGLLFALGVVAFWDGYRVSGLRPATQISASLVGGYEMLLGGLLAILAVVYFLRHRYEPGYDWKFDAGTRRVLGAFLIVMAYALLMNFLGYMLSTALALIALLRLFSPYKLPVAVLASCVVAVVTTWLWAELIIALPTGFIPWP